MAKRYKIIARSRTYGDQEILLDKQDYLLLKDQTVCVQYGGRKTKRFYAVIVYPGRKLKKLHRVILGLTDPKQIVDHINGNSLDNRRCNLRITNARGNRLNTRKANKPLTSKYIGVSWNKAKRKFRCIVYHEGKHRHCGYFDNEKDAAVSYNKLAKELYGDEKYLNVIEEGDNEKI
jgi:hypothetical protein